MPKPAAIPRSVTTAAVKGTARKLLSTLVVAIRLKARAGRKK
jgi:hypothetical protein